MAIKKLPSTGDAPRATGVPESLVAGGEADSAGIPWDGRTFDHHGSEFSEDDGNTPPEVEAAVRSVRAAVEALNAADHSEAYWAALADLARLHADAISVFTAQRFLVPMLTDAGDLGVTPEGRTVEKTQELSIVTVAAPDGRRVLPVFSSVAAMQRWHPDARPIPVPGAQVAIAAAQEQTDLIMIDAATEASEYGVRRTALEAMALGERVLPAWADADVAAVFGASAEPEQFVQNIWPTPGDPSARLLAPELTVMISTVGELDPEARNTMLQRLQAHWAQSAVIAERVDSMSVRFVAAGAGR